MLKRSFSPSTEDRQRILAVHEDDLELLLTKLGLMEHVTKGLILCPICGQLITLSNIGVLFKKEGRILISCAKSHCQASAQMGIRK